MVEGPNVVIHFKDLPSDDALRDSIEKRCTKLAEEFEEVLRFELALTEDGARFTASAHVTGKATDLATHATASEITPAADRVLDKVARQLRRNHDKRIFAQRREAQRAPAKRKPLG